MSSNFRAQGQNDVGMILVEKAEIIIQLLRVMVGLPPSSMIPDLTDLYNSGRSSAALQARAGVALELMVAASLPSAPENVETYTVGTVEVLLASNMSTPLMRVDVTNLNVAQPLLVSKKGVVVSAGGMILARESKPFVLPMGAELYGIVALGNILVTVGTGYQIKPMIDAILGQNM